jgi:Family of unknown function (DUF5678)
MNSVLTEIVEKTSSLTVAERNELIELLREQSNQIKPTENGEKKFVIHPNTAWIKQNHAKYAGNYVALKDGEFVASGKTIKEANEKAKSLGVENPFLHYMFPLDNIPFGGW